MTAAAAGEWSALPAPVAAYAAALNAADPDAVAACVTEDFRNEHASPAGQASAGRTAYRERLPGFLAAFPGLRYTPDAAPVASGDQVAVPYLMTAALPGGPLRLRGLWLLTLRDGLIAARLDYWDSGAVPPSAA
ncbi:nuclear transport factor 2 family protein [Parafrankia sp. FMc2]|uniref:nuclear transport factor 2 family protein n=1 Tax=Parafrankia sp. FMc2 TaxID=3233196 RepID=UPI0034D456E7